MVVGQACRQAVEPFFIRIDRGERSELLRCEGGTVQHVDQRIHMLKARHRHVEPVLVVELAQRHFIESINVDDEVERLPDGQEVGQHQQVLRLLVAFMAETERDQLPVPEVRILAQLAHEPIGAQLAEPDTNRSPEQADHVLPVASLRERIVVRRHEPEVVGEPRRERNIRIAQRVGNVERKSRRVRGAEVRVKRVSGQPPLVVLLNPLVRRTRPVEQRTVIDIVGSETD